MPTRRREQSGSGFIGQGTYGCTFSPPVPCDRPPIVLKNKKAAATAAAASASASVAAPPVEQIGKVYPIVSSAVSEFESSKLLNRIDPKQEVFLYSKEMCPVKRTAVEAQTESYKCRLLSSAPNNMSQLIQPHGGLELIKYAFAAYNAHGRIARAEIAAIILNLLSGIQRLIKLGYVHQDIKGPNVVVRPAASPNRPPEVRLIDFGTLMTFTDYYEPIVNYLMNVPNYAVNPPEYRLVAARNKTTDAFLTTEHYLLMEYIPTYLRSTLIARFGLHIATDQKFRAYVDAMLSKSVKDRISELRQSRAVEKSDLWSVGYSLMFVYQYLKPAADDHPEAVRLFQELITGLMRFIPDDRISIAEAIRLTKSIIKTSAPTSPDRAQAEYYQEIFAAPPSASSVPKMPTTPIQQTVEAQMYSQMTIAELRQRDTFKTMAKKGKWQLRKADLVASLAESKRAQSRQP